MVSIKRPCAVVVSAHASLKERNPASLAVMHDDKAPPAARVSAAIAILDRGYGRPAQAVYQQVTRHADELSDAELIAIATGGGESGAESDAGADEPVH